ncbi:hypothetical protein Barb7_02719 [Bacteroidales bacterium Barb7]|nr:hypothetical protein Barb7_02719 [Bacteroidales bacterium Barb7]
MRGCFRVDAFQGDPLLFFNERGVPFGRVRQFVNHCAVSCSEKYKGSVCISQYREFQRVDILRAGDMIEVGYTFCILCQYGIFIRRQQGRDT